MSIDDMVDQAYRAKGEINRAFVMARLLCAVPDDFSPHVTRDAVRLISSMLEEAHNDVDVLREMLEAKAAA